LSWSPKYHRSGKIANFWLLALDGTGKTDNVSLQQQEIPMPDIPFTQYLRPDGRKVEVSIDRPDDIYGLAKSIIERGYRFECEHLSTGHASLTIAGNYDDEDIEVVANGPKVPIAIDRMIKRFAAKIGISS
jgi:hypothetical protein